VLEDDPDVLEGRFWASGFLRGVAMRGKDWADRSDEKDVRALLNAVLELGVDPDRFPKKALPAKDRADFLAVLPLVLGLIHHKLRGRADPFAALATARRGGRKVGRNEPCPCGSGRKYKRCCGSAEKRELDLRH
jgi:uncharacterized protein